MSLNKIKINVISKVIVPFFFLSKRDNTEMGLVRVVTADTQTKNSRVTVGGELCVPLQGRIQQC
jgi:hypothetical protein